MFMVDKLVTSYIYMDQEARIPWSNVAVKLTRRHKWTEMGQSANICDEKGQVLCALLAMSFCTVLHIVLVCHMCYN